MRNLIIGPFWPAERQLVDNGYRSLHFPFSEITAPPLFIRQSWTLEALLGYICTWSAVLRAREARQDAMLQRFFTEIARLWGQPLTHRAVSWPVNMRVERIA